MDKASTSTASQSTQNEKTSSYYKYCVVPQCKNTTIKTPQKIFLCVPKDKDIRAKWAKLCRRDSLSTNSVRHICEDHFKLEDDLENYVQFKLLSGTKAKFRKGAVPHIFECQGDRKVTEKKLPSRDLSVKRARKKEVDSILEATATINAVLQVPNFEGSDEHTNCNKDVLPDTSFQSSGSGTATSNAVLQVPSFDGSDEHTNCNRDVLPDASFQSSVHEDGFAVQYCNQIDDTRENLVEKITVSTDTEDLPKVNKTMNVACQVFMKPFVRSKGVQASVKKVDKNCSTDYNHSENTSNLIPTETSVKTTHKNGVSLKEKLTVEEVFTSSDSSSDDDKLDNTVSDITFENSSSDDDFYCEEAELMKLKNDSLVVTREWNKKDPMFYTGVPTDCMWLLDALAENIKYQGSLLQKDDILTFIFRKIRLNDSFHRLSHEYGFSESYASKLFNKYIPTIANCMKDLIVWLDEDTIYVNLPVPFWARYRGVVVLIDCFEVEIETPGRAMDQSESWSDYKKCNTFKFLIGISPDGVIMFVSKAYLGRFSDMKICNDSGFIEKVQKGKTVMADRGFKGIEEALHARGCHLVRPPSTENNQQFEEANSVKSKKVSSLRIHVERLIRRLREFSMVEPHTKVHHSLSDLYGNIVIIAAGLVNLQGPLIRT